MGTAAAALGASMMLLASNGAASAQAKIPELMQAGFGWISMGGFLDPPAVCAARSNSTLTIPSMAISTVRAR